MASSLHHRLSPSGVVGMSIWVVVALSSGARCGNWGHISNRDISHDHVTVPLVLIFNDMLELLGRGHDGEGEAWAHVQNLLALWGSPHACDDSVDRFVL